jgi:hypothetical protein
MAACRDRPAGTSIAPVDRSIRWPGENVRKRGCGGPSHRRGMPRRAGTAAGPMQAQDKTCGGGVSAPAPARLERPPGLPAPTHRAAWASLPHRGQKIGAQPSYVRIVTSAHPRRLPRHPRSANREMTLPLPRIKHMIYMVFCLWRM